MLKYIVPLKLLKFGLPCIYILRLLHVDFQKVDVLQVFPFLEWFSSLAARDSLISDKV